MLTGVILAEILAFSKLEIGAVIRPFSEEKSFLDGQLHLFPYVHHNSSATADRHAMRACTGVTIDP
jgi:hypothetical protein